MAGEKDVLEAKSRRGLLCELVDGVLVEKTVGYYESLVAATLIHLLREFVERHDLGIVLGPDGTLKILPSQVRIPDVCVILWERFPGRQLPSEPIPEVAPDLAIEILSEANTPGEMDRKKRDYFRAGVRLVWYVDAKAKNVQVYSGPDQGAVVALAGALEGGDVLPGFRLPLAELFARAEGRRPA
jgi:Uma2 family endonuclease